MDLPLLEFGVIIIDEFITLDVIEIVAMWECQVIISSIKLAIFFSLAWFLLSIKSHRFIANLEGLLMFWRYSWQRVFFSECFSVFPTKGLKNSVFFRSPCTKWRRHFLSFNSKGWFYFIFFFCEIQIFRNMCYGAYGK